MVLLQQFKLSVEERHGTNDGYTMNSNEKQFIEHLFFLVSDPGLRQSVSMCHSCYKPKLSEEPPEQ